jgi:ferrous iron transport protein A
LGVENMVERIPVADMKTGETGTVVDIIAGRGVHDRLRALGIGRGVKVTKVSAAFARGPVVLQVYGTQTALGYGISCKIIVEVER